MYIFGTAIPFITDVSRHGVVLNDKATGSCYVRYYSLFSRSLLRVEDHKFCERIVSDGLAVPAGHAVTEAFRDDSTIAIGSYGFIWYTHEWRLSIYYERGEWIHDIQGGVEWNAKPPYELQTPTGTSEFSSVPKQIIAYRMRLWPAFKLSLTLFIAYSALEILVKSLVCIHKAKESRDK